MSTDLRFHIASLAAIFLALGLGIFVGTAFVGTPVVERQTRAVVGRQNQLIQRLDATINEMKRQSQEAEKNEDALRGLLPGLVAGRLAGRRALVVQVGDYADAAAQAAESVRSAGGGVSVVRLPRAAWLLPQASGGGTPSRDASALVPAAEALAALLVNPGASAAALDPYRRDGRLEGDTVDTPAQFVVLVGGEETPVEPDAADAAVQDGGTLLRERDAALVRAWQAAGVRVIGAESLTADVSSMRPYQALGVATVDNIDRAAGQIALPFALLGETAAFGMKPTADRILPESVLRAPTGATPP